ncbi:peptidase S8/S53 domain-containing protein [Polychytrium aggregatum]|uniref:peptidase S8/S53 domain-containing protein n=1 Tax=Polychytrium aggregatum TaxID=110093 RepID=UPI0022FE3512|nr:peptidase S8/S53 domain-containing protein [Polychytrium aggregatum]KAI9207438.1 peptidase S8/S53 domain-containing protein [Polychytrium aggregatum]
MRITPFCLFVLASAIGHSYAAKVSREAPLLAASNSDLIQDSYIVVLKDHVDLSDHLSLLQKSNFIQTSKRSGRKNSGLNQVQRQFQIGGKLKGYSGRFDAETLAYIRNSEHVEFVEHDQTVYAIETQNDAPWGLARISHRSLPRQPYEYIYAPEAGEGVTAYVVDTGVNIHHKDFEGRAEWGATIPEGDPDVDGNGHGTHVAGTIAGKTYGVAKKAKVKAIKVLRSNGSGSLSDVISGIDWVVTDHEERKSRDKGKTKSVANMSLGGGRSRALDRAVDVAVKAGVNFAVAAGNDGLDACDYSPAASQLAVTVGASNSRDEAAWFSNHGDCVDIFAPGQEIESAWIGSNVATNIISGTSMASPHIAGVLALLISQPEFEDYTPKQLKDALVNLSTEDALEDLPTWAGGSNRLVFTNPPKH